MKKKKKRELTAMTRRDALNNHKDHSKQWEVDNLTPDCRETLETRLRRKWEHKKQDVDKTAVDKETFFKQPFTEATMHMFAMKNNYAASCW